MKTRYHTLFSQRPGWQQTLLLIAAFAFTAFLLWIGLLFFIGFAIIGLAITLLNRLKLKLTGKPLFKGPKHFHRYQNGFSESRSESQHQVIEGEYERKDR